MHKQARKNLVTLSWIGIDSFRFHVPVYSGFEE